MFIFIHVYTDDWETSNNQTNEFWTGKAVFCYGQDGPDKRIPKSGISPKSPDWCVPELFCICPDLPAEPRESSFFGSLPA